MNGIASLSIANQGQDTDSAQLIAQSVPPDWEIRFEYGDLYDGSIIVDGIPRQGEGSNVVNVTVWAKPAQGGETKTANIQLIEFHKEIAQKAILRFCLLHVLLD